MLLFKWDVTPISKKKNLSFIHIYFESKKY